MSARRMIWRLALAVILLVGVSDAVAQMKVIPREKIDSIARPRTVTDSGMIVLGGERIDLGAIVERDGVVERVVEWENRGAKPIVITRTKSSCSCLSVSTDRTTVAPGERGELTLKFNPSQRLGGISYRVLIYTSLTDDMPTSVLNVSGRVVSSADGRGDYPEQCGALLLKSRRVKGIAGGEVRIACMNGGEQSLQLSEDRLLSPLGVRLYTEPQVLRAGEKGDVVIECDAMQSDKPLLLYINGLSLPPRQRLIVVELEK